MANKTCCCGGNCTSKSISSIKVLGTGCSSCNRLYENVKEACSELNIEIEVQYVKDMEAILSYGVMSMPSLIINEKVASVGRVLSIEEIKSLLK